MQQLNAADLEEAYLRATHLYQNDQLIEAEATLRRVDAANSDDHRLPALAGFIHIRKGEPELAIAPLLRACQLSPKTPLYFQALGDAYLLTKDTKNAERAFADVLRLDRNLVAALVGLCNALALQDRHREAVDLMRARIKRGDRNLLLLSTCASFETALNDKLEALETTKLAVGASPRSGSANHNLAASYGDLLMYDDAIAYARTAMELGQTSPITWLVMARALQGAGRISEAEAAYAEILRAAPDFAEAHRDYAQLLWMKTADVNIASQALRASLATRPGHPKLSLALAKVLEFSGDLPAARATLETARSLDATADLDLITAETQYALSAGDTVAAGAVLSILLARQPDVPRALYLACDLALATGDAQRAMDIAGRLLARDTGDIQARARYVTALRLLNDPKYVDVYAYDALVKTYDLEAPKGWSTLGEFLADLKAVLQERHRFKTHPFDQSLRHGRQVPINFYTDKHPVILGLAKALDAPIRAHLQTALRAENIRMPGLSKKYKFSGAWSVYLNSSGYHANHIHQEGWISSALYIDLPPEEPANPKSGWLKFGQPGIKTQPDLEADHWVKPKVGRLALFPSYMWHGTEPFTSEMGRLTVAMDVQPQK